MNTMKKNDAIMRKVWENKGFSNAVTSQSDIDRICEPVYEKFGAMGEGGYNACQSATYLCMNSPTQCNEAIIWENYSQALADGYSADYQTFKKRSKTAGFLSGLLQIGQGLFGNQQQPATQPTGGSVQPMRSGNNTALWIGGGLLVVGLGVGIYFLTRKK